MSAKSNLTNEQRDLLVSESAKAKQFSYSPYSKFRVGAAVLTEDGKIFTGCNVENASYGGCICAERTAYVKAVSQGCKKFIAIAIASDLDSFISPCGICRQFMIEFGKDTQIIMTTVSGQTKIKLLTDLLPDAFTPDDLPTTSSSQTF